MNNYSPYGVVGEFEKRIAEWCGSKYAISTESGTAAIFLSLAYRKFCGARGYITMPKFSYPSVPCSIIHNGFKVEFSDEDWAGEYVLFPLDIWDSALRLSKNMYHGGLQCLSFHIKKLLPIGRSGMILTDDEDAYKWLKLARFDGREPIPLLEQKDFTVLGFNMYMQPTDAARGIQLFEVYRQKYPNGADDLKVEEQGYPNLDLFELYKK